MQQLSKKDQLVETSAMLFHQRGYSRVSLADIAERTNMRQGNVYYYFKTKKEIAAAVLGHCDRALNEMIGFLDDQSPVHRLCIFLDHIADQSANYSQWGCPIAGLSVDMLLELKGDKDDQFVSVYATYMCWFQRNFEEIGLKKIEAKVQSGLLLSGLQGAIHVAHILGEPAIIQDFVQSTKSKMSKIGQAEMHPSR